MPSSRPESIAPQPAEEASDDHNEAPEVHEVPPPSEAATDPHEVPADSESADAAKDKDMKDVNSSNDDANDTDSDDEAGQVQVGHLEEECL